MPLDRAKAERDRIERELRKSPDFHLTCLRDRPNDLARMERVLMELPAFKLWRASTESIARAEGRTSGGTATAPSL